jgi:ZIP Zinc transporter
MQATRRDTVLLFAAIASHKVFAAISLGTRFTRLGCGPGLLALLLAPYHILPPVAVLIGASLETENDAAGMVLSGLSTGTFLYIGAFEIVCEEFTEHHHHHGHGHDNAERHGGCGVPGAGANVSGHCNAAWQPGKWAKFAAYVCGAGLLFAVTAGLPRDVHDH